MDSHLALFFDSLRCLCSEDQMVWAGILQVPGSAERAYSMTINSRSSSKHMSISREDSPASPELLLSLFTDLKGRRNIQGQKLSPYFGKKNGSLLLTNSLVQPVEVSLCLSPEVFLIPQKANSSGDCSSSSILNIIPFSAVTKNLGILCSPFHSFALFHNQTHLLSNYEPVSQSNFTYCFKLGSLADSLGMWDRYGHWGPPRLVLELSGW